MDRQGRDSPARQRTSRRGFFREALAGILAPLVELLGDRLARAGLVPAPGRDSRRLRPPGALAGPAFERLCTRCGRCEAACPAGAITMKPLPGIDPSVQACLLCEELPCVAACEAGALQPVPREQAAMGVAVWDPAACLLTGGEECGLCRHACPLEGVIAIENGRVVVDGGACAGCGCCQMVCPARPKAITVEVF
ncbi:MAG: hypothetical protein B1H04_03700 [Planctomycetales bacterium 4484_123]|nr:MAG: hypothetical protein B1H04_03700 [Planctomycetales bacterium 4484_123]